MFAINVDKKFGSSKKKKMVDSNKDFKHNNKPFAFAGLWETWKKKDDQDSLYKSCTIITTQASESIRDIHHRMPVILKPPAYESWLDPANQNVVELGKMLKNEIVTELVSNPVSKQVNSTRNNDPSCIEPIE